MSTTTLTYAPDLNRHWAARLAGPVARWLFVVALCAVYLMSGVSRLMEVGAATGALQHVGLAERAVLSGAEIILELGALGMLLLGVHRWLAALLLAGFTAVAAGAVSTLPDAAVLPSRLIASNEVVVQTCLALGFLLVAFVDLRFGQED